MDIQFVPPRKNRALAGVNLVLSFGQVEITLNDFRLLRKKEDGALWLAPPEFAVAGNGSRNQWQYTPIVVFDEQTQQKIEGAVIAAWTARGQKV